MSNDVNSITEKLFTLLGREAVLLPIPYGTKAPITPGWQTGNRLPLKQLADLDNGWENIGVLLGKPSGGLCSIDIDEDESVEPFLALNPHLRDTLRTKGKRGCNLWVKITGDYPKLSKLKHPNGKPWGEWRADGGQTVIYGRHPDGMDYAILNDVKALTLPFETIQWGALQTPWNRKDVPPAPPPEKNAEALYNELVREHGEPLEITKNGAIKLNHCFFVARYAAEHRILHEAAEREFYQYDNPRGLWVRQTVDSIKQTFAADLKRFADSLGEDGIHFLRTNSLLASLAELLRGHAEKVEPFRLGRRVIHLQNGMLHLDCSPPEIRPFSPDYHSRNQCPFPLVEGATCPQFLDVLLGQALDADDISLLQRWAGSLLLGGNTAQRILLLTGTPGGGKSTLLRVLETIVGEDNIHELRTEHLHERFELQFFIGKTLLTGKDVPGNFLQSKGAPMLKKLVGDDFISPERKGQNDILRLRGNFDVAITANSRLHVRLDGDAGAWRRRLMVIRYERPKPKERIANFGQKLLREEGNGILLWMVQGAIQHLAELETHADYVLTPTQQSRVEDLLSESDSVRTFVKGCVRPVILGDVTGEELLRSYREFCERKGWDALPQRQVERQLPDIILECFGVSRRNDIERGGRKQRGYTGVAIEHETD